MAKKNDYKDAMKALEMVETRFNEAQKEIKKYAKKDPERSMMIAAGIGAAIGAVLTLEMINLKNREEKL